MARAVRLHPLRRHGQQPIDGLADRRKSGGNGWKRALPDSLVSAVTSVQAAP